MYRAWRALASADSRILWRDPLLGWVLVLPAGLALLLRALIPAIDRALAPGGFDLEPFYPLIMSGYLLTAPGIVGMVVGFLVLDERDARTLTHGLTRYPLAARSLSWLPADAAAGRWDGDRRGGVPGSGIESDAVFDTPADRPPGRALGTDARIDRGDCRTQ